MCLREAGLYQNSWDMAVQEVLGEGGGEMTKYEACLKLKEWGCPQEGTELVYPDGYIPPNGIWNEEAYDDGILVPLLEPLLSFAESLAEERWPGEDYRIALIFDKFGNSDETGERFLWHAFSYATMRSPDYRQTSDGRANDPWWAVFNLIQKMMEG
jgi:hypothetical protein